MPVVGLAHGFGEAKSALMISAVLWSDAAMQIPLGLLSDRFGRRRVHAGCGVAMTVAACALPFATGAEWLMWPLLCVMGAAAGGIYTLAMVLTGSHYAGGRLVMANAALGLLWGAGNLAGPVLGGVAVGAFSGDGLMVMFGAMAAGFVVSALRRFRGVEAVAGLEAQRG